MKFSIDIYTIKWLAETSDGDARIALGGLELAIQCKVYDLILALHKSVKASDENTSLYWLTRMMAAAEDPVYIARSLVRMASEDIGLEDPGN